MMFTERHLPQQMPPKRLDDYLAEGWYRSGQSVFTCNFLLKEGNLYSVVWTRLPLHDFAFRRGQRKLMNKVKKRFDIVIRPEEITSEKEELYQIYREDFKGNLASSLRSSLFDGGKKNIYNTWEICVYDADKLVAFSIFDLGADSVQSIKAVYDPDYKNYSLGYFTMLAEIEYSLQRDDSYYYPGYVVPGYPAFDYKLRAGVMQYFRTEERDWRPYTEFDPTTSLRKIMQEKLETLQQALGRRGIPTRMSIYPLYETVFWNLESRYHLTYPLVLQIYPDFHLNNHLMYVYDPENLQYRFLSCNSLQDVTEYFTHHLQPDPKVSLITDLLGMSDSFLAGNSPKEAIYRMKLWMSRQMFL